MSEALKCSRESARDSEFPVAESLGCRVLQDGLLYVVVLLAAGGSLLASIYALPRIARFFDDRACGLSEANTIFKRSETMKRVNSCEWQLAFVRVVAVVVLVAALPPSAVWAASEAARVVKYSKEDIVPVHAKLRFSTLIVLPEDEEILDFTTGDKEFWIINGAHNLCYVHPAQAGIRSNLNLITASGHVYSFLLTEISSEPGAEPDLKIFIEPKETSGFAAKTGLAGYVTAGEAEAYKKELAALRTQTAEEIHAAEVARGR